VAMMRAHTLKPLLIFSVDIKTTGGVLPLPTLSNTSTKQPAHSKCRVSADRHTCEWLPVAAALQSGGRGQALEKHKIGRARDFKRMKAVGRTERRGS
jgi:hypothetical protein